MRLYTFAISHFSEKARWALDFEGLPYTERRLIPGPHLPVIRRLAPETSVPVLQDGSTVIQGSSAILDYISEHLGAKRLALAAEHKERSLALEAMADRSLGLGIQRIFYDVLLHDRPTAVDLWSQSGPSWARAFYAVAFPLVAMGVRRRYKIRPDVVAAARDRFRRGMDELDAALGTAPYLAGDAPSRVDIAIAALLAPMCRPPEHLLRWPTVVPEQLQGYITEFEGRPTWDFVLRMYRDHRRPTAQAAANLTA